MYIYRGYSEGWNGIKCGRLAQNIIIYEKYTRRNSIEGMEWSAAGNCRQGNVIHASRLIHPDSAADRLSDSINNVKWSAKVIIGAVGPKNRHDAALGPTLDASVLCY